VSLSSASDEWNFAIFGMFVPLLLNFLENSSGTEKHTQNRTIQWPESWTVTNRYFGAVWKMFAFCVCAFGDD
jgi:hypothetical protein